MTNESKGLGLFVNSNFAFIFSFILQPLDFGIGPPSPMHVSVLRKSNTTEFFGSDDR